jgi:hypothetical protein
MRVDPPIVGKAFPDGSAQQLSSQHSRAQHARNAGELTLAPKYPATRVQVRIARRHPMCRNFRTRTNRVAFGPAVPHCGGAGAPERHALARGGPVCAAWKANRPSVDTPRPSDMVENRKTCGISIGSASSTPPVSHAAANVRRLAKMASDDGHKADRGVR